MFFERSDQKKNPWGSVESVFKKNSHRYHRYHRNLCFLFFLSLVKVGLTCWLSSTSNATRPSLSKLKWRLLLTRFKIIQKSKTKSSNLFSKIFKLIFLRFWAKRPLWMCECVNVWMCKYLWFSLRISRIDKDISFYTVTQITRILQKF